MRRMQVSGGQESSAGTVSLQSSMLEMRNGVKVESTAEAAAEALMLTICARGRNCVHAAKTVGSVIDRNVRMVSVCIVMVAVGVC